MTKLNDYRRELIDIVSSSDFKAKAVHLNSLTDTLLKAVHSLYTNKVKIEYFQSELESKSMRFAMANHSVISICNPPSFQIIDQHHKLFDIFSIYSICRMQIESFIIIYYLMFDDIPTAEKEFRYDIYKLHGLLKQSQFKVTSPATIKLRTGILEEIQKLRDKIQKQSLYLEKNVKSRKALLNPVHAKIIDSNSLFVTSGLRLFSVREMWSIYSNHAHSEHIGDRQYNSMSKNPELISQNINSSLINLSFLTSKIIDFVCSEFQVAADKVNAMSDEKTIEMEFWLRMFRIDAQ